MARLRFNHMELTLPLGQLTETREEIRTFYAEVFDIDAIDVPILGQTGLLLRTDPETSQFILVTEMEKHIDSPGYDHLGFLYETRDEVDALLEKIKKWQEKDARVQIKEYEDLCIGGTTVHAFYLRHLLPIWFDVQVIEYAEGAAPARDWRFG
jgi:hypothetical protein